ncbi:uncharacterized protein TRAVEDRAFT_62337 [Trametes versicolor FP-101664 SS1]|uniref:uncharacterized protein n=1 Tax=Trametes versicolor (strain FP-101664) TaxID=717944 RepID=UPI0004623A9D|nr:uncharacterized protein TRAVEDRAFT_62337 [Trametes versicolor FP-101664 SS1]EIW64990.1 hypothetical protein TRAVEDRAFT_62337 [Trametes versicolor FP-101664 SS1]
MLTPTTIERAASLKAEGNALFKAKDHRGAYEKYTQAISLDDKNAILYCNRAACSLALARRLDAAEDADMGSLSTQREAINALNKALSLLPPENGSTPAIQKQRAEYLALLNAATKQTTTMEEGVVIRTRHLSELVGIPDDRMPWNLAASAIPSLKAAGQWNSSAWLIQYSRNEWKRGIDILKELKVMPGPGENEHSAMGLQGCVERLSNCVLSDTRSFKIMQQEVSEIMEKFPSQLRLELMTHGGWTSGGSRKVIKEASQQLKSGDLAAIREALSLTVRGWIMLGWIEEYFMDALEHALDYYTCAFEVLQWGLELWKDEDIQVPGLAFQPAFVRAVKCRHLWVLVKVYREKLSEQILEEVGAGAQDLIEELGEERETPLGEWETPIFLGFVRYQLAEAHNLRAWYYHCAGKRERLAAGGITDEVMDLFSLSAESYLQSAEVYPEDDEHHFWSLYYAYNILLDVGHPAGDLIYIMKRAQEAGTKMKTIWEVAIHTCVCERKDALESCIKWRADLVANIEQGTITDATPIMRPPPPGMK